MFPLSQETKTNGPVPTGFSKSCACCAWCSFCGMIEAPKRARSDSNGAQTVFRWMTTVFGSLAEILSTAEKRNAHCESFDWTTRVSE